MDRQSLEVGLFRAYREARRHKRNTWNQLKFEADLEKNIADLAHELLSRTYELSPPSCFICERPVKREIVAADFRDRVVHHLIYNWIAPIFERQFIFDSYSCRKGKGTLFGIRRVAGFLRAESDDFRRECFALRLDISGFFMGIDRGILHRLILDGLEKAHWENIPDIPLAKFILSKIVFENPLENAVFKSPAVAWRDLPRGKSLFFARENCGLPIGNLTSQLFANIYLNPLDHFVKRVLKFQSYGRYVDDMVFVAAEKARLFQAIEMVRGFLQKHLKLVLHPGKVSLQPVSCGVPFLGAFVLPWRVYLGKRVVKNFKDCLCRPIGNASLQAFREKSYWGLLSHFDTKRLFGWVG